MPGLSFVAPELLWLLAVPLLMLALALAVPRRLPPGRFYASLAIRTIIATALILALAGTQITRPVEAMTTVFLLDASASVPPSARAQAETFIEEALEQMPEGDRAAIVVFGEDALVERAPGSVQQLRRITTRPVATRTNIAEAIQLGLALFPSDAQKRLVLLSDGGENAGDALVAAQRAAARNIAISVVDLGAATDGAEVLVTAVDAPAGARTDQEIALRAEVVSRSAQPATVRLLLDDALIAEQALDLQVGRNPVTFRTTVAGAGFQQYRVQVLAADDTQPINNEAAALVQVLGPPQILLVTTDAASARPLVNALAAARINTVVQIPEAMPQDLAGLSAYDAVALINVPARAIPVGAMGAFPAYVRDLGRGLLMIGGERSFGVGGYGRTPVEDALPVYMDVRDREERPDLALVFVIDKSGSMDSCHCSSPDRRSPITGLGGYQRKVDVAKEAVAQAAELLSERDTIGVVTFDRQASRTFPATRGAPLQQLVGAMADVQPRGSTNVRVGLLEAEEMLVGVDARLKHVILLTDGWGTGGDNLDLAERLNNQGITLTVVAAGGGSAGYLDELARTGGGRYYPAERMDDVPQIFVQETITTVGTYIVERPFFPVVSGPSPVLDGIGALPALYGFNGSTLKDRGWQVLATDDNQPLLATWQYGLGRSAAWMSDTRGQWATDWLAWDEFPRFAAQLAGWLLPTRGGAGSVGEVIVGGAETTVRLTVDPETTTVRNTLNVTATLLGPDGSSTALSLPQVGPDTYETTVRSPAAGSYFIQFNGSDEGVHIQETLGAVVPYSSEYGPDQHNPALLETLAIATGGDLISDGAAVFAPLPGYARRAEEIGLPLLMLALILLPLDILIRRVRGGQ